MFKTTTRLALAMLVIGLSLPALAGDKDAKGDGKSELPIDHVKKTLKAPKADRQALWNLLRIPHDGRVKVGKDFVIFRHGKGDEISLQGTAENLARVKGMLTFFRANVMETSPGLGPSFLRNISDRADLKAFMLYVQALPESSRPVLEVDSLIPLNMGKPAKSSWKRAYLWFRDQAQMDEFDATFKAACRYHAALKAAK